MKRQARQFTAGYISIPLAVLALAVALVPGEASAAT